MTKNSKVKLTTTNKLMSRRRFLRGTHGVMIGLPLGLSVFTGSDAAEAACAGADPCRLVTFYFPNGCGPEFWNYSNALSPLSGLKDNILVMRGLRNSVSEAGGEDEHAQGSCNLFTGRSLSGSAAAESTIIRGDSLDQFASRSLDVNSALGRPLVTGVWRGFAGGVNRPSHWYRRSWRLDETTGVGAAVTPISNPADVFSAIFGLNAGGNQELLLNRKKSILDTVMQQYQSLTSSNSPYNTAAKNQFKGHLESIRDAERRLNRFQDATIVQCRSETPQPVNLGGGLLAYDQFEAAFQLQIDLTVIALSCGITNTASLMFCGAGEEYRNSAISNSITDHGSSHYASEPGAIEARLAAFMAYRRFHMTNLARLLNAMAAVTEANGRTLLDNSVVVAGSEFGDSKTVHIRSPQPHLVAGGGLKLKLNQELDVDSKHTPSDLYRELLRAVGIVVPSFGEEDHNGDDLSIIRV